MIRDVFVQHPRHGRAQAGQVRAAIALRNVVREAQYAFVVAVVPLHGHFDRDVVLLANRVKHSRMQDLLGLVDVIDKTLHAADKRKIVFLAGALVGQANPHAVIQERQFAHALGEDVVVEFHVAEDGDIGHEMHFGAAVFRVAYNVHGRIRNAVFGHELAVLHHATMKLHEVLLAVAAHGEAQPFGQAVHARHAHAVQAARDLVAVLVELAAGVQLGHYDFSSAALWIVLVVELQARRHAAAVVGHGDGVIGVNGDVDVVAMSGERFVDGIVQHFENEVVQTRAIRRIADIHPRPLADRLQTFKDLNGGCAISVVGLRNWVFSHGFFPVLRHYGVATGSLRGCCAVAAWDFSKHLKNAKGAMRPLEYF